VTIPAEIIPFPAADARLIPDSIAFLVRHGINLDLLREAAEIARACDVGADEALIRSGLVDEELVYRALAAELGCLSCRRSLCTRWPASPKSC
jgi:hypothetical protein